MAEAEVCKRRPEPAGRVGDFPVAVRVLLFLAVLFLFFVSIKLMGSALKCLTEDCVENLLGRATENPFVGLLLGILCTSLIQSSSTTTSITVILVASGTISLPGAIPIIMGANIGTTVTNTLVSLAHVRRKGEFERALAAGTVHDWFNVLAVLLLFPVELITRAWKGHGLLEWTATWIKGHVIGTTVGGFSGLNALVKPAVSWFEAVCPNDWLLLAVSLFLLFLSLSLMVKIMRSIFINKMARLMDRVLFRNAPTSLIVGLIFTVLVQSSSVTTSLVVPLVGAGILSLEQIFPYTLGANIGTTVTAFLAALAVSVGVESGVAELGVTVALVHLLFNVFGILLVYPFRALPLGLARWLARVMSGSPARALLIMLLYFAAHLLPLLMFLFF